MEICQSVIIQGSMLSETTISLNKSIKSCEIILGSIQIYYAKLDSIQFTNLIEVTDYILIFQIQNIKTLSELFPKLSIIRGDRLYQNYALTIFLSTALLNLNLKNLISIQRGSIFISKLIPTCYITTVDWNYILKDDKNTALITATNNDCHFENCQKNCTSSNSRTRCWSERDCQLICPNECPNNCNINTLKCCKNLNCMHCYNDTTCVACTNLRNFITGECVDTCPSGTLLYESHSCLNFIDCTLNSTFLTRRYFIYENSSCVRDCPNGYRNQSDVFIYENKEYKYQKCVKCDNNVCKKDCLNSFKIKTLSDLQGIKNCVRVKELVIELNARISNEILEESLKYLEEIENYLIISNNRYLTSLKFMTNLRVIHGKKFYDNKYTLFIHKNELLRNLWNYRENNFSILNGMIKFLENPEFCLEDVDDFIKYTNRDVDDADILSQFNGYKRLTCSNNKFNLTFSFSAEKIGVSWQVSFFDRRRLNGYRLYYIEAHDNLTFDPNDISFGTDCANEWNSEYVEFERRLEGIQNFLMNEVIKVKAYTRYAIYVKADINFVSSQTTSDIRNSTSKRDKVISDIYYVYSSPTSEKYFLMIKIIND